MRFTVLAGCAVLLMGCMKKDAAPAADTTAMAPPPAPAPAPVSLASMAGKWHVIMKPEGKDTVVTSYLLDTSDSTKWHFHFDKRTKEELPLHITGVSGDTVMTMTDWIGSSVKPGLKVKTETKNWMQDGKLMGSAIAHYQTSSPDSVLALVTEGTRQ
jgi:hypothetical protein